MIRRDDWKLIYYAGKALGELYHLSDDPLESRNRYADPAVRGVRDALTEQMIEHLVATESPGLPYRSTKANAREFLEEPERGSL